MDSPKGVSRTLSLLDTLVNSPYKDALGDESTDRENPRTASNPVLAVKEIPESFHFFEKLPIELRNRVYELSLCRGKVFVKPDTLYNGDFLFDLQSPNRSFAYGDRDLRGNTMPGPAHDFQGKRRPRYTQWEEIKYDRSPKSMGLLQGVSKSVQEEATQIFYGPKNHFVLPTGIYTYPETSAHSCVYDYDDDESPQLPPFKSMSYTFDMRDVHQEAWSLREHAKEFGLGEPEKGDNFDKLNLSSGDIMVGIHDLGQERIEDLWEKRCEIMRSQLALKFLQIDFEECYCPTGCCRMALKVCSYLGPFKYGFPDKFEVIGVRTKAEATSIREKIAIQNEVNKVQPGDIRCVDLNGQSIDYEAPAPAPRSKGVTLKIKLKGA